MRILQADERHVSMALPLFEAYRGFFTQSPDLANSRRFLEARLKAQDSVIFIAAQARHGLGFLQLYPIFSSWYARRIWFLSDLYVEEASRGQSIGHRLVETAIEHAQRTSASSVMVELPHSEPHLQRFYARFGFKKDATFDLYRLSF